MSTRRLDPGQARALAVIVAIAGGCGGQPTPGAPDAGSPDAGGPLTVSVDNAVSLGALPRYVYSAGIWVTCPAGCGGRSQDYLKQKYLADGNRPGVIQVSLRTRDNDCYDGCPRSFKAMLQSEGFADLVGWLTDAQARGGKPVLVIDSCPVPTWLSACEQDLSPAECASENSVITAGGEGNAASCPLYNRYVPADLDLWAHMMQDVAAALADAGLEMAYITYHEPEPPWGLRTAQQYFDFHRASVLGIKRADPAALVGTFGATGAIDDEVKKDSVTGLTLSANPMMYDFIEYSSRTPLPEVGLTRLPIDFVNWHIFHKLPSAVAWRNAIAPGQQWLAELGYDAAVPFYPGDWNLWDNVPTYLPGTLSQDTEVAAAYVVASVIAMDAAGIEWHSLDFDVDVWGKNADTEFEGRWPLFTHGFVTKAAYNALRMISLFEATERVAIASPDPFLSAVAGRAADGRVFVLAANFVPYSDAHVFATLARFLEERGYATSDLAAAGVSGEELRALLAGTLTVEELGIADPDLEQDLTDVLALYQDIVARQTEPVDVRFALAGLAPGATSVTTYLIDADHANAYAIAAEVDAAVAAAEAGAQAAKRAAVEGELGDKGYTQADLMALQTAIAACAGSEEPNQCVFHWIDANPGSFSKPVDVVKADLASAYQAGQAAYVATYTPAIDAVNDRPEVTLAPVGATSVDIMDGRYALDLTLAPYASLLVVLSRP
jgi:hypothetical protein